MDLIELNALFHQSIPADHKIPPGQFPRLQEGAGGARLRPMPAVHERCGAYNEGHVGVLYESERSNYGSLRHERMFG